MGRLNNFVFMLVLVIVVVLFAPMTKAAVIEVGLSGYAYDNIQDAYHSASSGDEIVVHAGTYTKLWGDYSLYTAYDWTAGGAPTVEKRDIVIRAAGDGPAIMKGVLGLSGLAVGVHNITIDGLYINPETVANKCGVQIHPSGFYMEGCTVRNVVVYGEALQRGVYFRNPPAEHGQHLVEHCTFINTTGVGGYKGLDDRMNGTKTADMVPIMRSNISVGFEHGFYSWYGGPGETFTYSDGYGNTVANYQPASYKGVGSVELDPVFYSLDPANPNFLYLSPGSPIAVQVGAHDGTYMGALPVIPEPATLALLGLGALVLRRKRA
ncbi:MAG: PEP-CTERM sorting domain-containing protein [Planctomycetota bacterium]